MASKSGARSFESASQSAFLWYRTHVVLTTGRRLDPWGDVMPDYGCPSGTNRRSKMGTVEEALGHMWHHTINAPRESGTLGDRQASFKIEDEPKLKKENTFLTFKLGEFHSRASRPRASSDDGISYACRLRADFCCDLEVALEEDSDGEVPTVATGDGRSRTNSDFDEMEESTVHSKTSWGDDPSPSSSTSSGMAGSPPLTKPPGVFVTPLGAASTRSGLAEPASAVPMAACRGQLSELSIAALRAEVEAGLRDETKDGKSAKKPFSVAVAERISEQQKLTSDSDVRRTSIQLRQLPASMTRSTLVATLNAEGFKGTFDFVYVPIYFDSGKAFGYAFLNCITPDVALEMEDHFSGFTSWASRVPTHEPVEPCEVAWTSEFQGLLEHLERYRSSPVMHSSVPDDHKPALFTNGLRIPFPSPTRKIAAPRRRKCLRRTASALEQ